MSIIFKTTEGSMEYRAKATLNKLEWWSKDMPIVSLNFFIGATR